MTTAIVISITLIAVVAIICYTVLRCSANQKTRVDDVLARVERDVKRIDKTINDMDARLEVLIHLSSKNRRNG